MGVKVSQQEKSDMEWVAINYLKTYSFFNKYNYSKYDGAQNLSISFNDELFSESLRSMHQATNINRLIQDHSEKVQLPQFLSKLSFDFTCCRYLEDETLQILIKKLPQGLQKLELNLFNCANITEKCVEGLGKYGPKNLKELRINFGDCQRVSYIALNYISKYVEQLKDLKVLDLSFQWSEHTNNDSIKGLFKVLQNLKELKKLKLNFENCKKINNDSLKIMGVYLKGMQLQYFDLNMRECSLITCKTVGNFMDQCEKILQDNIGDFNIKLEQNQNESIEEKVNSFYEQRRRKQSLNSMNNSSNTISTQNNNSMGESF